MYGTLSDIAIAFIGVAILAVVVDRMTLFLQAVMKRVPFLPDEFEDYLTYIILVGMASAICWQGHFDLFSKLNWTWHYNWEGYLATGAMAACGTTLLIKEFKVMGFMPSIISGVSSMFGLGSSATTDLTTTDASTTITTSAQPESNQKGE
jgi:hypothetical protein